MLYQILTIINILISVITIISLVRVARNYYAGPRNVIYILLLIINLTMLMMVQFYALTYPPGRFGTPVYKIPGFFFLATNIYYAWMVRFQLVKKDGTVLTDEKDETENNQSKIN
jgi:hypothetical protein